MFFDIPMFIHYLYQYLSFLSLFEKAESCFLFSLFVSKRLAGATLLVFANKQDLPGSLTAPEIREVNSLDSFDFLKSF